MKHKTIQRIIAILFCILAFSPLSFSQSHTISGKVSDAQNRQPLAFVNIVVNDGLYGGMSDIDGRYSITSPDDIKSIRFSYIGYETKIVDDLNHPNKLNVSLTPITFELHEATVDAGENPAHRIIDSVMAHRKQNNPSSLQSYSYKIYDKMVFTIDSSQFNAAKMTDTLPHSDISMFDSILRKNDLMVMETASEVKFLGPDNLHQNVLGTKVAGMKDPTFMYLVNEMQSVSFYEDEVAILGTKYLNPLSRGSKTKYFFNIESATPTHDGDTLFSVSFHPYKGTNFDALTGVLDINSDGWAVQSVKAAPSKSSGLLKPSIQQLYQKIDGQWFPKQYNVNLVSPSTKVGLDGNSFPLVAIGKSYLTDIQINPEISKREFSEVEISVDNNAAYRDEDFWLAHRIDSLSARTQATYVFMDSLTEGNNIFDRALGFTNELIQDGSLPLGIVSLDLSKIIRLSGMKGWYFGLGFCTNDSFSRIAKLNAYGGYWTHMKFWDYGGGITFSLNKQKQMKIRFNIYNRSEAIGEFHGMQEDISLLGQSDYRFTFYENISVRQKAIELTYETRFAHYFKAFLTFGNYYNDYLEQFFVKEEDVREKVIYSTAELKLRFAYNEKFISDPQGLRSLGTDAPIVWFSYKHCFNDLLGCTDEFDRFKLQVEKNFYSRTLGITQIMLQAGYATEDCPVMETFTPIGSNARIGLYAPGSFGTMFENEFFCDRFAALFLSHNFSGMLWQPNTKFFKPELTLATNLAWGDMRRNHNEPIPNFITGEPALSMDKGFFESGIVVNGLLSTPLAKIGAGVFYRYGAYAFPETWDNFAWKICATLSL